MSFELNRLLKNAGLLKKDAEKEIIMEDSSKMTSKIEDPIEDKEWLPTNESFYGPWVMKNGRSIYYNIDEGLYYDKITGNVLEQQEINELFVENIENEFQQFQMNERNGTDPYGGSAISPYDSEPDDRTIDDYYVDTIPSYIETFFDTNEAKVYLSDINDRSLDNEDRKALAHDLISSGIGYLIPRIEDDNMMYFSEDQLKELLHIELKKHLTQ